MARKPKADAEPVAENAQDTCFVAVVEAGTGKMNLTVYRAPGGWRWLAHDTATGGRTGDAADSDEEAKRAAETFARKHVPGSGAVRWNMAYVRRQGE